jgi:hypothetical protein
VGVDGEMSEAQENVLYSSGAFIDSENTAPSLEVGPFSQRKLNADSKHLIWSNIQVTLVRFICWRSFAV